MSKPFTSNDTWGIIRSYFECYGWVRHHVESFDDFVCDKIPRIISDNAVVEVEREGTAFKVEFGNVYFVKPHFEERPLSVQEARSCRSIAYEANIYCDVNVVNGENVETHPKVFIGALPVMVGSALCNGIPDGELGGYFILRCGERGNEKGSERVVIPQERSEFNRIYVFPKRKSAPHYAPYAEVRSSATASSHTTITTVGIKGERIYAILPYIPPENDIPIAILFRALGVEQEVDMVKYIIPFDEDEEPSEEAEEIIELLRPSFEESYLCRSHEDALCYIGMRGKYHAHPNADAQQKSPEQVREEAISYTRDGLIATQFLPHLGKDIERKRYYLGCVVKRVCDASLGKTGKEDRDNYEHKRMDVTGSLLSNLFYGAFRRLRNDVEKVITECAEKKKPLGISGIVKSHIITNMLSSSISTGEWQSWKAGVISRSGVTAPLERFQDLATISQLCRAKLPAAKSGVKLPEPRRIHTSQFGIICPAETPEGENCGLTKQLSILAHISIGSSAEAVEDLVSGVEGFTPFDSDTRRVLELPRVVVNGKWLGTFRDGRKLVDLLVTFRRNGDLSYETSISFDEETNEVKIFTDVGRLMRPLFIVRNGEINFSPPPPKKSKGKKRITKEQLEEIERETSRLSGKVQNPREVALRKVLDIVDVADKPRSLDNPPEETRTWDELLKTQVIEYLDKSEEQQENILVCISPDEFFKLPEEYRKKYTHCEINPSSIYGVNAGIIPHIVHNPPPRNSYQAAMGRQAVGFPILDDRFMMRRDYHQLFYAQKPMAKTKISEFIQYNERPTGMMVTAGIMPFEGSNQEDGIILNKASIERGLFNSMKFKTFTHQIQGHKDCRLGIPTRTECSGYLNGNNRHLSEIEVNMLDPVLIAKGTKTAISVSDPIPYGVAKIGSILEKGDTLIGILQQNAGKDDKQYADMSVIYKETDVGRVSKIYYGYDADGYLFVSVRVNILRIPTIGDKFASRFAQKGTCCRIVPEYDLPFCSHPRLAPVPDLILNSLAIPSRMTIGHIIETHKSTLCSIEGKSEYDASPFTVHDILGMIERAGEWGVSIGSTRMYSGTTGELMEGAIVMGLTYYQRLKHMVDDKMHARARGPNVSLLRQPTEGRANNGGLRVGEMERDSLLAHGATAMVRDRLFKNSDYFTVPVCSICGMIAVSDASTGIRRCDSCDSTDVKMVEIPYGAKVLFQELIGCNVFPRMIV